MLTSIPLLTFDNQVRRPFMPSILHIAPQVTVVDAPAFLQLLEGGDGGTGAAPCAPAAPAAAAAAAPAAVAAEAAAEGRAAALLEGSLAKLLVDQVGTGNDLRQLGCTL